jgi:sulfatase maturation enzyme AslB (radical SAM superfamily)
MLTESKNIDIGTSVNTIYFTNRCNLACTYCYEVLDGRPKQIMTKEDIEKSIKTVIDREPKDKQTSFVLFGGEPLLEWDNVQYSMEYAYKLKKNVAFLLITNGLLLLDKKILLSLMNNKFFRNNILTLEISFDGIGNSERIYKDGKESTDNVLKVFSILKANNIKFNIRYTINKINIEFCEKDILLLIDVYSPERLVTSITYSEFSKKEIKFLETIKNNLFILWNQSKIKTPICSFFCDNCNGCSSTKENKSYFSTEGNVRHIKMSENQESFSDFKGKK